MVWWGYGIVFALFFVALGAGITSDKCPRCKRLLPTITDCTGYCNRDIHRKCKKCGLTWIEKEVI